MCQSLHFQHLLDGLADTVIHDRPQQVGFVEGKIIQIRQVESPDVILEQLTRQQQPSPGTSNKPRKELNSEYSP